jgi:hypothetical protein
VSQTKLVQDYADEMSFLWKRDGDEVVLTIVDVYFKEKGPSYSSGLFFVDDCYLCAVVLGLAEAFAGAGFSAIAVSSMA